MSQATQESREGRRKIPVQCLTVGPSRTIFPSFYLTVFSQFKTITLIINPLSPRHKGLNIFRSHFMDKNKANPLPYCLQTSVSLLAWLMACLLLELEEMKQRAAGSTHLLPLTLIKDNSLSSEPIWLGSGTKRHLQKIWQVLSSD